MGKHGKYAKHYRVEWEKIPCFKNWLTNAPEELVNNGKGEAYCKLCKTPLRAHKTDLQKHMKSKTHSVREQNMNVKKQPKLSTFGYSSIEDDVKKKNDIKLAAFVAMHGTIRSVDHLGEVLKEMGKNSPLENLQLHRTKCSNIIKNILEPALCAQLVKEIGDQPFSILLDESTDVSSEKNMAYMIRYYNEKEKRIMVDFLGFQELYRTTAEAIYSAFKEFMTKMGLKLERLIAVGTDGASNLCGNRNSLYTHLKAEYPQVQLLKCVCHSLSLCAAKSCEVLPSSLEYMLRETRNWFSHSPLRAKNYQMLYETLNNNKKPPKLTQLSATRWLAFHAAVDANIKQWIPLKTHFNIVANSEEKCYQARELAGMYNDECHLLYLVFLGPLLKDVTDVNLIFQAETANISKIYDDLRVLLTSTAKRVFKPASLRAPFCQTEDPMIQQIEYVKTALSKADSVFENSQLTLADVDFGPMFEKVAEKIDPRKVLEVRKKCAGVLIRMCHELVKRLPENVSIIQGISTFDVSNVFSPNFVNLPLPWALAPPNIDADEIQRQRRIVGVLRPEDIMGQNTENLTPEKLWIQLLHKENAGGKPICTELAEFALRSLSMPISNATVERVFSIMNVVKCKMRNRMQLPMLQAVTRVRLYLGVRKICCKNFLPTKDMVQMHSSKTLYDAKKVTSAPASTSSVPEDDGGILEEVILLVDEE